MPRKMAKPKSNQDLLVVLLFLLSFVFFLFSSLGGLCALFFAFSLAVKSEKNYVSTHPHENHVPAGFWVRLGSLWVDGAAIYLLLGLFILIEGKNAYDYFPYAIHAVLMGFIQVYMYKRWGQTPGKMVMGIKVLKADDYGEIGWKESILRYLLEVIRALGYLFRAIFIAYGILDVNLLITGQSFLPPNLVQMMTDKYQVLFSFWFFSELFVLLTNRRRRALHDFLAGTVVVVLPKKVMYYEVWIALSFVLSFLSVVLMMSHADYMYRVLAEKGNAYEQACLGKFYASDMSGKSKDYSLAFQWCQKAALQGNADGEFELGYFYDKGLGVTANKDQAIHWFTLAYQSGKWGIASKAKKQLKLLGVDVD